MICFTTRSRQRPPQKTTGTSCFSALWPFSRKGRSTQIKPFSAVCPTELSFQKSPPIDVPENLSEVSTDVPDNLSEASTEDMSVHAMANGTDVQATEDPHLERFNGRIDQLIHVGLFNGSHVYHVIDNDKMFCFKHYGHDSCVKNEINLHDSLTQIGSPYLLNGKGVILDHTAGLLTDYMTEGSLRSKPLQHLLAENRPLRLMLTKHMIQGALTLHQRGIIHLDFHDRNLFVTKDDDSYTLKIGDFGNAIQYKSGIVYDTDNETLGIPPHRDLSGLFPKENGALTATFIRFQDFDSILYGDEKHDGAVLPALQLDTKDPKESTFRRFAESIGNKKVIKRGWFHEETSTEPDLSSKDRERSPFELLFWKWESLFGHLAIG